MMASDTSYERELSRAEVAQRKDDCLDLLTERDGVLGAIDERKREIKTLDLEAKSLDARISLMRHEIRSGKTLVTRQQELPLDRVTLGDHDGEPVEDYRERPKNSRVAEDALAETADTLLERPTDHGAKRAQAGEPSIPGLFIPTCRMPAELEAVLKKAKRQRKAKP